MDDQTLEVQLSADTGVLVTSRPPVGSTQRSLQWVPEHFRLVPEIENELICIAGLIPQSLRVQAQITFSDAKQM